MKDQIRLFHLEDYKIVRDGIKFLLSQEEDILVVGEAKEPQELFNALQSIEVDVLLLDIYLDGMKEFTTVDGFQICKTIRQQYPRVRVLAHSVYDDADRVARIMNAGAVGFVSKKAGFEELVEGIRTVSQGTKYICRETAKRLKNINEFLAGIEDTLKDRIEYFSKREMEVLELLSKGFSTRDIAEKLFISEKTVESHRMHLVQKAQVKNTNELIAYAAMRGLINK
jgi:DNA-binding NarL/FixJ family response regulator